MAQQSSGIEPAEYIINLDGRWGFAEFGDFSKLFNRLYSVLFVIENTHVSTDDPAALHLFRQFAWRGAGFSAAHFYREASQSVPAKLRPKIKQIAYASPGFIELGLIASTAVTVGVIVKASTQSAQRVSDLYHRIYMQMRRRKLTRIETQERELDLIAKQKEFLKTATQEMARTIGFQEVDKLQKLTGNELSTLKVILAITRTSLRLGKQQAQKKIDLPADTAENLKRVKRHRRRK